MSKKIQFLVIHCTDTPAGRAVTPDDIVLWHRGMLKNADGTFTFQGKKYTSAQLRDLTMILPSGKVVAAYDKNGRGWKQVGYTDMVLLDGKVERLVDNNEDNIIDPWEVTNGVAGINSVSRHIVYVGGKSGDTRTVEQKKALESYVLDFVQRFPDVQVAGHYQFDKSKSCPGFDVPVWCREIGIPDKNIRV